jgi:hypothetical protein
MFSAQPPYIELVEVKHLFGIQLTAKAFAQSQIIDPVPVIVEPVSQEVVRASSEEKILAPLPSKESINRKAFTAIEEMNHWYEQNKQENAEQNEEKAANPQEQLLKFYHNRFEKRDLAQWQEDEPQNHYRIAANKLSEFALALQQSTLPNAEKKSIYKKLVAQLQNCAQGAYLSAVNLVSELQLGNSVSDWLEKLRLTQVEIISNHINTNRHMYGMGMYVHDLAACKDYAFTQKYIRSTVSDFNDRYKSPLNEPEKALFDEMFTKQYTPKIIKQCLLTDLSFYLYDALAKFAKENPGRAIPIAEYNRILEKLTTDGLKIPRELLISSIVAPGSTPIIVRELEPQPIKVDGIMVVNSYGQPIYQDQEIDKTYYLLPQDQFKEKIEPYILEYLFREEVFQEQAHIELLQNGDNLHIHNNHDREFSWIETANGSLITIESYFQNNDPNVIPQAIRNKFLIKDLQNIAKELSELMAEYKIFRLNVLTPVIISELTKILHAAEEPCFLVFSIILLSPFILPIMILREFVITWGTIGNFFIAPSEYFFDKAKNANSAMDKILYWLAYGLAVLFIAIPGVVLGLALGAIIFPFVMLYKTMDVLYETYKITYNRLAPLENLHQALEEFTEGNENKTEVILSSAQRLNAQSQNSIVKDYVGNDKQCNIIAKNIITKISLFQNHEAEHKEEKEESSLVNIGEDPRSIPLLAIARG